MEKLGSYAEMLVPNPSEWEWELEPLDQYGVEIPGTSKTRLTINGKNLVRGPKGHTHWRIAWRQELSMVKEENKCRVEDKEPTSTVGLSFTSCLSSRPTVVDEEKSYKILGGGC
jgi:hypothetical protein